MHIKAVTVNDAMATALRGLDKNHVVRSSRVGPIIAFPGPVMTEYSQPTARVLFSPMRNANPVFHLMEALWMLAGRNDLKFVATFANNMRNYSDDGVTLHGAYGHRWRNHFGYDQLGWLIDELKANPYTRRAVLTMWDGGSVDHSGEAVEHTSDLYFAGHGGKDVPCNTSIYFDCRGGKLNMTVNCRSNDLYWGCYGANVVHMSVLLEYMAASVGIPVGVYRQFSNDLHLYTDVVSRDSLRALADDIDKHDCYASDDLQPMPMIGPGETLQDFDDDLRYFFEAFDKDGLYLFGVQQYNTDFFNFTVSPMLAAWKARKTFDGAPRLAEKIESADWRHATKTWILRNFNK